MKKSLQELQDSLQKAWTDALSSLHGMEDELARRFRTLKDRADIGQGSEEVQRVLSDMRRRLQDSAEALEQRLEDNLRRVKVPFNDELARLKARAEGLSRRVESQLRRKGKEAAPADEQPDESPSTPEPGQQS